MKTVELPTLSSDLQALLEQARHEDVVVRSPDGAEFMLFAVDDFDREIILTRRNDKLMALLDARGKQTPTIPLDEVKQRLGLQ